MRERGLVLDLTKVPRCHRCGAAPEAERDSCGYVHVTWRHEHDCPVPDSLDDRALLAALLARSFTPTPPRGTGPLAGGGPGRDARRKEDGADV